MTRAKTLLLTPGCPAGIGPEVLAQAMLRLGTVENIEFVFAGTQEGLVQAAKRCGANFKQNIFSKGTQKSAPIQCLYQPKDLPPFSKPGEITPDALHIQSAALQKAVELGKENRIEGIVTAPIRKAAMKYLGNEFLGHTEFLHAHLGADQAPPLMAFSGGPFLLGLASIHVPLAQVPQSLTAPAIENALCRLQSLCQRFYQIPHPKIVVLGLNPHAGEEGLLGREEKELIAPTLEKLQKKGLQIVGPVSADGFFARFGKKGYEPHAHGVLAMFHDQGLAPYKILSQGAGVNITCGLKLVRTSPDHGTADDIAGKNIASSDAMYEAIKTSLRLLQV